MSVFRIDMSLYKGDHELYRKLLQAERQKIKTDELSNVSHHHLVIIIWFSFDRFFQR